MILDCSYNYQIRNMGQQVGKLQQNNNRPREKRKGQKEDYLYRPPPSTHMYLCFLHQRQTVNLWLLFFFFKESSPASLARITLDALFQLAFVLFSVVRKYQKAVEKEQQQQQQQQQNKTKKKQENSYTRLK